MHDIEEDPRRKYLVNIIAEAIAPPDRKVGLMSIVTSVCYISCDHKHNLISLQYL